jgi:hypothetical protein
MRHSIDASFGILLKGTRVELLSDFELGMVALGITAFGFGLGRSRNPRA